MAYRYCPECHLFIGAQDSLLNVAEGLHVATHSEKASPIGHLPEYPDLDTAYLDGCSGDIFEYQNGQLIPQSS